MPVAMLVVPALAVGVLPARHSVAAARVVVGAQDRPNWVITTADFNTQRGRLTSLGEAGVGVERPEDGQRANVPADRLVRLERAGAGTAPTRDGGPVVLHLRNGDRLRGAVLRMTETALVMQLVPFGEVEIPLEELRALVAQDAPSADITWSHPAPPSDEVLLANGDRLRGYVSAIGPEGWTLTEEAGGEVPLAAEAVREVRFADPGVPNPAPPGSWRARLADGSLLTLERATFEGGRFTLAYRGREATDGEGGVVWLEQINGPVRWLSDLPIAEQSHTPYLGTIGYPIAVDGLPMASGRGFIVRSRSRLSFDVPEGYERLRARYAMPANMTHGNADVRILLDDRVAHELKGLAAGQSPAPVEIPLNGAKRVTLEVDYGQGIDVQDVVYWIEPAFVRSGAGQ